MFNKLKTKLEPQLLFYGLIIGLFAISLQMEPLNIKPPRLHVVQSHVKTGEKAIPNFAEFNDVQQKKQAFFDFLQPFIDDENEAILSQREGLEYLYTRLLHGQELSQQESGFLASISEQYKVDVDLSDGLEHIRQLLRRVDVIPSALVLSQGANESAWGTSRFAQEGNNFFGQWCYTRGCGIVPSRRGADQTHEVRRFDSVADSIHGYFMNLNTFSSYKALRSIRLELRLDGESIDGISLSEGLSEYSARGSAYINELQSMMHSNDLLQRDEV